MALSCVGHPVEYFADCSGGSCDQGFKAFHKGTGHWCGSVLTVRELKPAELERLSGLLGSQSTDEQGLSSVVKATTSYRDCFDPPPYPYPQPESDCVRSFEVLPGSNLAALRSDWDSQASDASTRHTLKSVGATAVASLLVCVALAIPWWIRRRRLSPTLLGWPLAAQPIIVLFVSSIWAGPWASRERMELGIFVAIVLLIVEAVEFFWLASHALRKALSASGQKRRDSATVNGRSHSVR